ncbi:MAG TPA: pyridoxal-phosphate dependent enzyme [Ktedonobacteraceae bacterium]|nr:pyridoxal-phosphate dependent enzyme [Ktedonobacteraceae bacterium]
MRTIHHRLSLEHIAEAARTIDPVFMRSPQFLCEPLSELPDIALVLKVETLNPIRSFKGRGADFLVSRVPPGTSLVCASAGNFGQAMAYACRKRGVQLTVYAATSANVLKVERMRSLGATVVLSGKDFDDAKLEARHAARTTGARFVEDSLDIETLTGAGTIGLELLELPGPLDALLVALGNGALFTGVARVIKECCPQVQMIAVQAAGAPAMVESWRAGQIIVHDQIQTIADGIGVRLPIPQALEDIRDLIDRAILVQEDSLLRAMRLLHQHIGIVVEPSAAVGVAALLEQPDAFRGKTIGTIVCGSNLTTEQMREWL